MQIKAILFDAGNTLVFIDPSVVLPILRKHGADVVEREFWEAEFSAREGLTRKVEEGAWGTENHIWKDYFADLFRSAGVPEESVSRVGEEVRRVHGKQHLWSYMDPSTPSALDSLAEAGYRLAIISNADGRVEDLIKDAGIRDRFEFVMDSELEGIEKPDPEIFLRACRRMGIDPGESLYVGDLYGVDVVGARNAGLQAVLMDPMGRLDYPVDRIRDVSALPAYMEQLSHRP